jgi:glucosylglycerate phosphorylase
MSDMNGARWGSLLRTLYGDRAGSAIDAVAELLRQHGGKRVRHELWSERDAWLITYPDQFRSPDRPPLQTLRSVFQDRFADAFNGLHVLPFFPSSSDEGFSVTDYLAVDPSLGTWADIAALAKDARLMLDAVVNHASMSSSWFRAWSRNDPAYRGYFRTADPSADLSSTVRAREHPLLTKVSTARGEEWAWTTFSPDQADLDYRTPDVLLSMLSVLLTYAQRGASIIRLDAAGFLWKEEGTPSIHLPQTHEIIQFFRACLDETYPNVVLVSETNVPHDENVRYLGDDFSGEADMVYRFTLPPLTLHAFAMGNAEGLARWLDSTTDIPRSTTYLNFLGSHDGVGLRPLEGLVDDDGVERLVRDAERFGGMANRRTIAGGTSLPYELNATWFDLIRGQASGEDAIARHLASHAIMFAISGVPAVYVHALLASHNAVELMRRTGSARSINRARLEAADVEALLGDPATPTARSVSSIARMLTWRRSTGAFHPNASQRVLDTPPTVFGVERTSSAGESARVYVNVSELPVTIRHGVASSHHGFRIDRAEGGSTIGPWGSLWLLHL